MDNAERIFRSRKAADDFLVADSNFERTSNHPSWQGKIKCRYCKATGYPGSVQANNMWWGQRHGYYCKWKELWELKARQKYQATINYTYATNTGNLVQWQNNYASTYYRMKGF